MWWNTLKYRFRLNCSIESSQPQVSAHLYPTAISNPWLGPSCLPQLPVTRHLVPETEHYPVIYGWVVPSNHPLPASQPKLGAGMQESNFYSRWSAQLIYTYISVAHAIADMASFMGLWMRRMCFLSLLGESVCDTASVRHGLMYEGAMY